VATETATIMCPPPVLITPQCCVFGILLTRSHQLPSYPDLVSHWEMPFPSSASQGRAVPRDYQQRSSLARCSTSAERAVALTLSQTLPGISLVKKIES